MKKQISTLKNFIKNMNYQTLMESKRVKYILDNQGFYQQGDYVIIKKGMCQLLTIDKSQEDPYIAIISPKGYWYGAGKKALAAGYLKKDTNGFSVGYEIDQQNIHTVQVKMFDNFENIDDDQLMLSMMVSPAFFKVISESQLLIQAALTSAHNQVLWRVRG